MISRIQYAKQVCAGKRVLDIGGKIKAGEDHRLYARKYREIRQAAREYRIVDILQDPAVQYVLDLNRKESLEALGVILKQYRPEVVLCMETLEHVNYHFEILNVLAEAVERDNAEVVITLPNNANWIINFLIGIDDHSVAFFKSVARRFITRSDLGKHSVKMFPCTGTYLWYWPLAYILAGFQPNNFGFHITRKSEA